jgi:aspartate aminotransferase
MVNKIVPATRLAKVSPSAMRELFEIAGKLRAQGKKIIDFGLGDIDIPLPSTVREGMVKALDNGKTRYGPNSGEISLRQAIAKKYKTQRKADLTEANILVSCGALESLLDIALAYVNPGDEVIFNEPSFPYFGFQTLLAGGNLVPISLDSTTDFKLTPELLNEKITSKTKLVMVNFPTNPTGAYLSKGDMKAIVEICQDKNILLISDEVYEFITYDDYKSPSVLDFNYENVIVVNSASKALCMTGIRVGYSLSPAKEIIAPVAQVHQYNTAHAGVPNQLGVLKGLEHEEEIVATSMKILNERRQALIKYWGKIPGVKFDSPKATFYLYPDISGTGMNSTEFSKFALEQGVVVVPGHTFCFNKNVPGGENHVRLSYGVGSTTDIKDSAQMLIDGLQNR